MASWDFLWINWWICGTLSETSVHGRDSSGDSLCFFTESYGSGSYLFLLRKSFVFLLQVFELEFEFV